MNIIGQAIQGLAKAGLDKMSEVIAKNKDEKRRAERILLRNENIALKEYQRSLKRRMEIEKKNSSSTFSDLVSRVMFNKSGGDSD